MNAPAHPTPDLVIQTLLAMPKDQQKQVLDVLLVLHGEQGAPALSQAAPATEQMEPEEEVMTLEQFMQDIEQLPPYERLLYLDQVLQEAEDLSEQEHGTVTSARLHLLNDHKWLALRYGVTNYAMQKPFLLLAGVGGLLLLVITLCVTIFRKIL